MSNALATGDDLLRLLAAMANPHRLRIVAALSRYGVRHVSDLARLVGISRPLLYLHLEKLEQAGVIHSHLALSDDGKALRQVGILPFHVTLSPDLIARFADTLTDFKEKKG
ncbi:ArsR/SmtB family transcription factor [Sphingopyxis indica]|uniref:Transcriptional regulator, ArsR family n=1 Tax=Sphingopyxis indica TaxID=436663 RepID=A0A239JY29_9SPHN|nr:helix-turn-helix domain-containing protein [Sphingopyxis indica]SNT10741.1 transcriptional regulator, ArsR family [Sphingopyxis indica]